jgi:hypothetical protein
MMDDMGYYIMTMVVMMMMIVLIMIYDMRFSGRTLEK